MNRTYSVSRKRSDPHLVGLTGGIASGKTAVSDALREMGVAVVCADVLARDVVAPGRPALAVVAARFGLDILDTHGHLDRKKLGRRVFSDAAERTDLERILHPEIRQAFRRAVADIRTRDATGVIVYDAPLLIEAGAHREVSHIWVVQVDRETQLQRLMERDGISRQEAMMRIDAQLDAKARLEHADEIIDGTLAPEALRRRLEGLVADIATAP